MEKCKVCESVTSSRCSSCQATFYCSKEHQKLDWKTHKKDCLLFEIKEDKRLGRYLVAKRDIRSGEVVLKESPLIDGPSHTTGPVCLGCYEAIKDQTESIPCEMCGWPMCSTACSTSRRHVPECRWTQEKRHEKVKITMFTTPHPTYSCVLPLRLCYLRQYDASVWKKITDLESHCEQRKKDGKYEQDRFAVAKLLLRFYSLDNDFTEEEILKICGIIQINGHEIPLSEPPHIAIYWRCSLFEHNCLPNCSKTFSDSGNVIIRAAADISKGQHLSISYTDPIWGTPSRRHHLSLTKYFSCQCVRCSDPTESGTYFSAIKCPVKKCSGLMLPKCFLREYDTWKCNLCSKTLHSEQVNEILNRVAEEMFKVKKGDIDSYLRFHDRVKHLVPDRHYHVVETKLTLAQTIGQTSPKGLAGVSEDLLGMKETLCHELLTLANDLFRAENRIKGVLYFELHAAVAEKTRRNSVRGNKSGVNLHAQLLESGGYLKRVIFHLKYEPEKLPEGKIYQQAIENLKDLEKLYSKIK